MYTYFINIGSLTTPVRGSGWLQVYPFVGNASLKKARVEGEIFARTELSGKIKFTGDTFDALQTLSEIQQEVNFQIKWKGTAIYNGLLALRGEANPATRESWHEVVTDDDYSKLLAGKDTEVNILGGEALVKKVKVDFYESIVLEFNTTPHAADDVAIFTTQGDNETPVYARQAITLTDAVANLLIGKNGWYSVSSGGGNTKIARAWDKAGYDKDLFLLHTALCENSTSGQWILNDHTIFNSTNCPNLSGTYSGYICGTDFNTSTNKYQYYMILDGFFQAGETFTFTRFRKLNEVIEDILSVIAPDIVIDSQTFQWGQTAFNHLLVAAISDCKLSWNITERVETSNPATKELITWQQLWDILHEHPFGIFWYLESGALRIRHISAVNITTGSNPDLTSWHGVNWSQQKRRYTYDRKYYKRLIREITAGGIDFQGVDVVFEDTEGGEDKKITQNLMFTDIAHIFARPEDYPDNGIVMLCGSVVTGQPYDYETYSGTGILTGMTIVNEPLSLSSMDNNSIAGGAMPYPYTFAVGNVNAADETLTEVKRRMLEPIYAPFRYPDEVDFFELVTTDSGDVEAVSLEISLEAHTSGAKFTGVY